VKFALYYRPEVILIHKVTVTPHYILATLIPNLSPESYGYQRCFMGCSILRQNFPTLPESLLPPFSRLKWSKQSAFFGIKMEAVSSSVTFDHGDIVSQIVYIFI
jgi:hypothetical protein